MAFSPLRGRTGRNGRERGRQGKVGKGVGPRGRNRVGRKRVGGRFGRGRGKGRERGDVVPWNV